MSQLETLRTWWEKSTHIPGACVYGGLDGTREALCIRTGSFKGGSLWANPHVFARALARGSKEAVVGPGQPVPPD